jgi:hypothetical protein
MADTLRTRVLPAFLTALGVVLLTAGLLSYADPTTAGTVREAIPTIEALDPTDGPLSPTGRPSDAPSAEPSGTPAASAEPTPRPKRAVATRVVIPALNIDLPVVKGNSGYPLCNVAMYLKELSQPGEGRATYLFAHARDGMFGPIYRLAIEKDTPKKMLGMIVQVYTSDDKLYLYEVRDVRLHQRKLDAALQATAEELWLQTSEGPKGTPGKTQLRAKLLSVGEADHKDAHPKPMPVRCG